MFGKKAFIYSMVLSVITLIMVKIMQPSAGNPEDVVRYYLAQLRIQALWNNYDVLSTDAKKIWETYQVYDKNSYSEYNIGSVMPFRKYAFINATKKDTVATVTAEVQYFDGNMGAFGQIPMMPEDRHTAPDTFEFLLVKQDDGWRIDKLLVDQLARLP